MPKTAVGLFENPDLVDDVVREIETLGFPRKEVRTLEEVHLARARTRIGAAQAEAQAYVEGLRRGGALVFATGSDENVEAAADIMNRRGAVEIEETSGSEPQLPGVVRESMTPMRKSSAMTGRVRQSGGGACLFVW